MVCQALWRLFAAAQVGFSSASQALVGCCLTCSEPIAFLLLLLSNTLQTAAINLDWLDHSAIGSLAPGTAAIYGLPSVYHSERSDAGNVGTLFSPPVLFYQQSPFFPST